jgi:hypothetical protein
VIVNIKAGFGGPAHHLKVPFLEPLYCFFNLSSVHSTNLLVRILLDYMNRLCNTQSGIAIDQKPKQYAELQAVSKIKGNW